MPFAISPEHMSGDFGEELTFDDRIDIFVARVKGWQIQPALEMRERDIPNRGFAQLHIVISYFEMVGKHRAGFIGEGQSGRYFKEGLLYTFPDIQANEVDLLDALYKKVRNGLYHVGMTMPNVVLADESPGSIGYHEDSGAVALNPDTLVEDISIRFEVFSEELRDRNNESLRCNFVARFDSDNGLVPEHP